MSFAQKKSIRGKIVRDPKRFLRTALCTSRFKIVQTHPQDIAGGCDRKGNRLGSSRECGWSRKLVTSQNGWSDIEVDKGC